jgi:hypothetical protein
MRDSFIAKVVDVNDPEKAGRVKIRAFGLHDDTTNLPDIDLPWARCVYPVTSALNGGVTGPTTGLTVGSTVTGRFIDMEKQTPIVEGTLGRAVAADGGPGDFPLANVGEDTNDVLKESVTKKVNDKLKSFKLQTIGSINYTGQSIASLIQNVEQGNVTGALRDIKNTARKLNDLKNTVEDIVRRANNIGDLSRQALIGEIQQVGNLVSAYSPETGGQIISTVNHLTGFITDASLASPVNSLKTALNRIGGSKFVMGNTMGDIESGFATIKTLAKKKKQILG